MSSAVSSMFGDPCVFQKTLVNPVYCTGTGLHSGQPVNMRILPASVNSGISFARTDQEGDNVIPGLWSSVSATDLCTQISNQEGKSLATIEHLMAALALLEIDNVIIEIDGPEVPVMDGSAEPFIVLLAKAGIHEQSKPRQTLRILKEIEIHGHTGSFVSLKPSDRFSLDCQMDFSGRHGMLPQSRIFAGAMPRLREELSRARTFGFLEDVEKMRAAGFARGGSLENAVVIDKGQPLNPEGLRFEDEQVRHKALDAIGDLYLAGGPIKGTYTSCNGGHMLNNKLLRALMADPSAWVWEETTMRTAGFWEPVNTNLFEPFSLLAR